MSYHKKMSKWNAKCGQKSLSGEVKNPVCYHGNETVKLALWSTFSIIIMQRITNRNCLRYSSSYFNQNLVEC